MVSRKKAIFRSEMSLILFCPFNLFPHLHLNSFFLPQPPINIMVLYYHPKQFHNTKDILTKNILRKLQNLLNIFIERKDVAIDLLKFFSAYTGLSIERSYLIALGLYVF